MYIVFIKLDRATPASAFGNAHSRTKEITHYSGNGFNETNSVNLFYICQTYREKPWPIKPEHLLYVNTEEHRGSTLHTQQKIMFASCLT